MINLKNKNKITKLSLILLLIVCFNYIIKIIINKSFKEGAGDCPTTDGEKECDSEINTDDMTGPGRCSDYHPNLKCHGADYLTEYENAFKRGRDTGYRIQKPYTEIGCEGKDWIDESLFKESGSMCCRARGHKDGLEYGKKNCKKQAAKRAEEQAKLDAKKGEEEQDKTTYIN